jgi:hypothetical protein
MPAAEWRLLGSFCDPFGFCQGVLQQIEFTARLFCDSERYASAKGAGSCVGR